MSAPDALARASFPRPLLEVLGRLAAAGHRSYLVGGAVRDLLLHRARDANDFDVATPATPAEVTAIFQARGGGLPCKVIPTGIAHGTVTVVVAGEHVEVTTFRGEGAYEDGRRPGSVTFHRDLEADLARRDFTMNAMAYDPLGGDFADPFGGQADMARRRVRAVGDPAARFGEDGLRALRAVRFAAQLGYRLDPATRAAIPGAIGVVRKVSVERVAEELEKLLLARGAPRGLLLLARTGLLEVPLPAVSALPAPVLVHLARLLGRSPLDLASRLAVLLHRSPGPAEPLLLALRLPRRVAEEAGALLRAHVCLAGRGGGGAPARRSADGESPPALALPRTPVEARRWLAQVGRDRARTVLDLAGAEVRVLPVTARAAADADLREVEAVVSAVLATAPALETRELALDGRAVMAILGAGPGARVGEALRHLLDRVLEDPSRNTREGLEAELRSWWERQQRPL